MHSMDREESSDKDNKDKDKEEEIVMLKPSQLRNNPLFNSLNFTPMTPSKAKEQENMKREERQEVMPNLFKSFAPPRHPAHYST